MGTISFVLDKRVDDILKKEAVNYPELSGALSSTTSLQRAQFQSESESVDDDDNDTSPDPRIPTPKDGLNRQERRFRKNFLESEKKDSE